MQVSGRDMRITTAGRGVLGALAMLASLPACLRVQAETVDFESALYTADKTLVDLDRWARSTEPLAGNSDNFKIQAGPEGKWLHCLTTTGTTIYRTFPDIGVSLDLRWRWRPNGDNAHLCLGVSDGSASARAASRALACIDPFGVFEAQGSNPAMRTAAMWSKANWYYMRMDMDAAANRFSLYMALDSLRAGEVQLVASMPMSGEGALSRVVIRDENGAGDADIDDISWDPFSIWQGNGPDTLWSTAGNWSGKAVPDSLTHAVFDGTSAHGCLVDKDAAARSLTFAPAYTGDFNLGASTLALSGKADFTGGGSYTFRSGGRIRLSGTQGQSLSGPDKGRLLPPIRHDGSGTVRLDGRALSAAALEQAKGAIDFNGFDLAVQGDLTVSNGRAGTLAHLDGRSISVGRTARLEGISQDTLLDLDPAAVASGTAPSGTAPSSTASLKGWSITVGKADTLFARFAAIGGSHAAALGTGVAVFSADKGGNTGWAFGSAPTVTSPPDDAAILVGAVAAFRVSVAGGIPLTYQWLRNGSEIAGAKDSVYLLVGASLADNGASYSCRAANAAGTVHTGAAALAVSFPAPVSLPGPTAFPDSLSIRISSAVANARLIVSGNGSTFSPSTGSITLHDSTLIKAYAVLGSDTSLIGIFNYPKRTAGNPALASPQANPPGGTFTDSVTVTLTLPIRAAANATLYYAYAGSGILKYSAPFTVSESGTLKAIAVLGSTVSDTAYFTFTRAAIKPDTLPPMQLPLKPGQGLDIAGGYRLTNPAGSASSVTCQVLAPDSLPNIRGFRDIGLVIRLSLPEGSPGFPKLRLSSPTGDARPLSLYAYFPPATVSFMAPADSLFIRSPGTYFLAMDTLPPEITLLEETFLPGDSTRAVFTIKDNVLNLLFDVERSDAPKRGFTGKPIGNPETVVLTLKNPAGSIAPLTLRLRVRDHSLTSSFPADTSARHCLAQQASEPVRTPGIFSIGKDKGNPWDLLTVPLNLDPPLTLSQLRRNNSLPGLQAAAWSEAGSNYRYLDDEEPLVPGASLWIGAPTGLASFLFPAFRTVPRLDDQGYRITLHKGWNQVANPSLRTLYWPVSRMLLEAYDLSPVKGLIGYDGASGSYVHSDSLEPWRGYFVYSKAAADTVMELGSRAAQAPSLSKSAADGTISLAFGLGRADLRLGAAKSAADGLGVEDEPRPPSPNDRAPKLWSSRGALRLETDLLHLEPGSLYAWKVIASLPDAWGPGNSEVSSGPGIAARIVVRGLRLPDGYAAWAVSRTRGLRFRLSEGGGIPLAPGFTDTLDIFAGTAAELQARLGGVPESVGNFAAMAAAVPGGFILHLRLPRKSRVQWNLWALDGRALDGGDLDLLEGIYDLARGGAVPGSRGFPGGLYALSVRCGATGSLVRKIAIP